MIYDPNSIYYSQKERKMPCIFMYVPTGTEFRWEQTVQFHQELADAIKDELGDFEVHVLSQTITILRPDGVVKPATNVHSFILGHGRSLDEKDLIAYAIHRFLYAHGLWEETDTTFFDAEAETFWLNGINVSRMAKNYSKIY